MILDCRIPNARESQGTLGLGDVVLHDDTSPVDSNKYGPTTIVSFQDAAQKSAERSGSFTQRLIGYLSLHGRDITPPDLVRAVTPQALMKSVSVTGMRRRLIFEARRPDQSLVTRLKPLHDAPNNFYIAAGSEYGFQSGQVVQLADGDRRIGRATVLETTHYGGSILSAVTGFDASNLQSVEAILPYHILKVHFTSGGAHPEPGASDWYNVVPDRAEADIILTENSPVEFAINACDHLFNKYNCTFLPLNDVERLSKALDRIARFRTMLRLSHAAPYRDISPLPATGNLELEMFPLDWDVQGAFLEPSGDNLFSEGYATEVTLANPDQCYGLKITQNYGADMFLYLLAFNTADFSVNVRTHTYLCHRIRDVASGILPDVLLERTATLVVRRISHYWIRLARRRSPLLRCRSIPSERDCVLQSSGLEGVG